MPYGNLNRRREKQRVYTAKYQKNHPMRVREALRQRRLRGGSAKYRRTRAERKLRVLTRYSPNATIRCSWPDCIVVDVDMLTLDHVHDDGAARRRALNYGTGDKLYSWLETKDYPDGFQTLCCNHQLKKHLLKVRERADSSYLPAVSKPRRFSVKECKRRRRCRIGKRASLATRRMQSISHKKLLENPAELKRLADVGLKGAAARKLQLENMTAKERSASTGVYGTIWATNGRKEKRVFEIPPGWRRGRS